MAHEAESIELLEYVRGRRCRCGRHKAAGSSFCGACAAALNDEALLYELATARMGAGFEEAYGRAKLLLGGKGWKKGNVSSRLGKPRNICAAAR